MASLNASDSDGVSRDDTGDCGEWSEGIAESCDAYESKTLGDDLLDDLDSYWEDINDRLTISRMVSDSIIKGMVNAVSEEATERVVATELEVAELKSKLRCLQCRDGDIDSSVVLSKCDKVHPLQYDRESLASLNQAVKEHLEELQNCISYARRFTPWENISTQDMQELDGKDEESLMLKNDLYETFDCLKATLKAMCQQVDVIAYSPETFLEEWKLDLDIRKEVEALVFCTIVEGLRCEFERQIWDVNNVLALIDKLNEISSLRHELISIQKCFVGLENENLSPQGSIEMDHFHRKFSINHGLSSQDANGENGESKFSMPEKLPSVLKHMSPQELYQHFRTEITQMKREHESTVQKMTEENFTLRRELLKEREPVKERGPFAAFKKDRDFDVIKKNISGVIEKLDVIVRENEKLSEFCNHSREKLDSLLSENQHLKDLLDGQKFEVRHLSMQASVAAQKLLQRSWAEENMHKLVGDLKNDLQDEQIEASITKEVFKCMIREMASLTNSSSVDLDLKSIIMQDIIGTIYEEAFHSVDVSSELDCEEYSDLQSSIIQQIHSIIFQEVLRDMSMELKKLKEKCLTEDEGLLLLQRKQSEIENELTIKIEENKELRHNILVYENSIVEKDKLLLERTALHETEKTEVAVELNNLMCLKTRQEALISERNGEIVFLNGKLEECQKQLDFYKFEVDELNKALELSKDELRKSDVEKTNIRSVLEQKQSHLESIMVKNSVQNKHMESLCHVIHDLSKSFADFEFRVKESVGWHNVRLENSAFQLHSLIPKVNVLRRTGSLYKERLEKKCSDLQKAETEVDLLGDEVDALLSLLEKIYVALDHYSPILQHYPGIIEVLKLVKRELSGEAIKAV